MGMEAKDYERMAIVEEQVKQLVVAVTSLSQDLRSWQQNYVPRQEIGEMFRSRDKEISDLSIELEKARQEKNGAKALAPSWAAVAVSVIALVVTLWTLTK